MPAGDELLVWVRRDGELTVVLAGEFDLHGVDAVLDAVTSLLAKAPARVAIDLSGVPFVDSAALSCLPECRRRTLGAGGEFHLGRASPEVRRILALAGLDDLLP